MQKLVLFLKSHVGAYTRADGTVVQAHETNRPAAGLHHRDLREGDQFVSASGEHHEYSHTERGLGRMVVHTAAGHTFPTERDGTLKGFKKTGHNFMDRAAAMSESKAKPARKKAPAPAAVRAAPAEGDVGHEEYKAYGKYFRKGDKVRDQHGKTHEVMEHRGPSVSTYSGQSFHPTKLWHAD